MRIRWMAFSRGDMTGPWRKVEIVDFPVGDLEQLAEECGGWVLDPLSTVWVLDPPSNLNGPPLLLRGSLIAVAKKGYILEGGSFQLLPDAAQVGVFGVWPPFHTRDVGRAKYENLIRKIH